MAFGFESCLFLWRDPDLPGTKGHLWWGRRWLWRSLQGPSVGNIRGNSAQYLKNPTSGVVRNLEQVGAGFEALCLHCTVTTPTSEFDCSRLSIAALPGHAPAQRRRNPVSDHQPAGGRLPSTQAPRRRLGRDGGSNTILSLSCLKWGQA